ncbi:hypothetical protein PH547_04165 [Rhizobium sp. CNPSo 3464]|uniref:hypothetical protein n=1 Tax=Rhizobium sp. CNPSo 3464 TaxID=3021406 RepID=UPI002550965A|nr:hypothetical protein [Rhizobium sp. CNPSo 3464]MDK4738060.1 hypothetical protein [Rhizobium sp. CNPSo 3464]
MSFERREVKNVACLCGKGRLHIDVTYNDTDWGIRDEGWEAEFSCVECREAYRFVRAGRGVDVIRVEDYQRRHALIQQAAAEINLVLLSDVSARAIEKFASVVEALPTASAKYRLLHELKIESATLATFRKHIRGISVQKWLSWMVPLERDQERSVRHLVAIFDFLSIDSAFLRDAVERADALKARAFAAQENAVMSLGPITLFAAFGAAD